MNNKRNHPLTIGEVVFDVDANCFGVIVNLTDKMAELDMTIKPTESKYTPNLPIGWCEQENKRMFDSEIREDELHWTTKHFYMLYQVAWDLVDSRTNNIVLYEHNYTQDDYPYYSPYLVENLFNFEVEKV